MSSTDLNISDTLLSAMEVNVEPFAVCDVSSGATLDIPSDDTTSIHYVLAGEGDFIVSNGDRFPFRRDHIVIVPSGLTHQIRSHGPAIAMDTAEALCLKPDESLAWLKAGQGSTHVVLACGRLHVSYGQTMDLFGQLNQPICESCEDLEPIRGIFEMVLKEHCNPRVGALALTSTLMKQCLILLLRKLQENDDQRIPMIALLKERGLQAALKAIFDHPQRNFSVEDLADIAAMSRSSFAERFTRVLGQTPHAFLSAYRLRKASQLLETTQQPVESVAHQVGFQSRSSFTRAFRKEYGVDPATYRRNRMLSM